ncbi:DNA repair protein RadC [Porticoccaceae bacterium LTM1]|nr:DNA repair protein RadC [Porticoccaceae bacterium LTM1]
MSIREWPEGERPRERMIELGAGALSDAELLAIFLRTGSHGLSAVDLARELLTNFGGLAPLLESSREQFCGHRGLGEAKYTQLQAARELSNRHLQERLRREEVFTNPGAVVSYLRLRMQGLRQEVFAVLFMDSQHRLINYEELFRGTIDGAAVYPREVVRRALELNAAALILAHNHPSGIAEPSEADVQITDRLKRALELIDVRVLDHIIVGSGEVVSLAERGRL